jgi:hypothetical protein
VRTAVRHRDERGDLPVTDRDRLLSSEEPVGCSTKGVFNMRFFTITMLGLVCLGMTGLAMANPAMLPEHPGYPSGGEFAYDTGRKNLTYSQSIEEAAKSGDTRMGLSLIDPKNTRIPEAQGVDPLLKGAVEQPAKNGMRIPKK